jgi:precorrin-6B methylase 1
MDSVVGSDTALQLIAAMQKKKKEVISAINESNTQTLVITERKTIAQEVAKFLSEHGTELLEIL